MSLNPRGGLFPDAVNLIVDLAPQREIPTTDPRGQALQADQHSGEHILDDLGRRWALDQFMPAFGKAHLDLARFRRPELVRRLRPRRPIAEVREVRDPRPILIEPAVGLGRQHVFGDQSCSMLTIVVPAGAVCRSLRI